MIRGKNVTIKFKYLLSSLRKMKQVIVAYSGGVDSTFLLRAAIEALGCEKVTACIAESPLFPHEESVFARGLCRKWNVAFFVISTHEMNNPAFVRNASDRCYHCKKGLFKLMLQQAKEKEVTYVLDGSNVDDRKDHRPGRRALQELGIVSPLLESGFTKQEIRKLSRALRIPTADKPSLACLGSRIPYGTRITEKGLQKVHNAERIVRSFGILQCRVRDYGDLARIEVLSKDIQKLTRTGIRAVLSRKFKKLGYKYVTLDLEGYRTGSMNFILTKKNKEG